ncbi:MAG: NUDIX domain-containing protein [Deltaproteobacteria bacterium]|nr:NUDIX domain-containing protein [Deltaproteobacteria bacterium]
MSDELLDVVDEHDRVLTQATRQEVRRQNLRHRCAYIFVFNTDGQIFVHQRTLRKDVFPGYWDVTVGGVVAAGEGYDACAVRELREELGAKATLRRLFPLRYEDERTRIIGMVYSCTANGPFQLQREEIEQGSWMDFDEAVERAQHEAFCPDGLEAFRLYLSKLAAVRLPG